MLFQCQWKRYGNANFSNFVHFSVFSDDVMKAEVPYSCLVLVPTESRRYSRLIHYVLFGSVVCMESYGSSWLNPKASDQTYFYGESIL